jgi:glycosyltransferase involved in cell wall biosynthesis
MRASPQAVGGWPFSAKGRQGEAIAIAGLLEARNAPHGRDHRGERAPLATVSVSVVIPTLNEASNLPHVFARLPRDVFEVIVVDGGSEDDTVAVAKLLWPEARVLTQERHGKGAALATGFKACRGDVIVTLDADGSTDPAEIPSFVEALVSGADFAKGSRFMAGGASADITLVRRIGNHLLGATVNLLFGTRYTDLCYGYNAFWARCLPLLCVDCDGFEIETLLNIRVARVGLQVAEIPSHEHKRLHGSSKLRAWRDGRRVLRTIVRERLSRAPSVVTVGRESEALTRP